MINKKTDLKMDKLEIVMDERLEWIKMPDNVKAENGLDDYHYFDNEGIFP